MATYLPLLGPTQIAATGTSVPSGGTTGQALVKNGGADYDVSWQSVVGATSYTALTDAATAALPTTNTPLAAALALKADILAPGSLGTGAVTLNLANSNRHLEWGGSGSTNTTATVVTTSCPDGTAWEVYVRSSSGGSLTMGPVVVAPGQTRQIVVTDDGVVDPNAGIGSSGSLAPVSVSGSTVNGSVLTRALAAGWTETGGNWTRDGSNISGATSSTYTTVSADGGHVVTWKSASIPYVPTGISVAAVVDTTAPSPSGAPHVDSGSAAIVRQNFDEALVTNGIAAGDCTVSGKTVSSVAISGTELQITVSAAFTFGQTANLSVAANKLKDAAGNLCAAITSQAITNNVPATGVVDNFSGTYPARSDGGSWSLFSGTAPVNSGGLLTRGSGNGSIYADLGKQNGTYSFDVNTTVGTGSPVIFRFMELDSNNFAGCQIDSTGAAFGINLFVLVGGAYTNLRYSASAVFTSGVTGTVSLVVTGAPSAVSIHLKFNGTDIPMSGTYNPITDSLLNSCAAAGGTYTGLDTSVAGISYDNFSAT